MFLLIALVLVIAGIVVLVRYNQWAGIALIVVGVLVFLLRGALGDGLDNEDGLRAAAGFPMLWLRRRRASL